MDILIASGKSGDGFTRMAASAGRGALWPARIIA